MTKYFFFLLAFFISLPSVSQDLIVTSVGDSIACKIVAQTNAYVQFFYTRYNHTTLRALRQDQIKSTIGGFYLTKDSLATISGNLIVASDTITVLNYTDFENDSFVISDTMVFTKPSKEIASPSVADTLSVVAGIPEEIYSKWSFGINGGYAYRLFRPAIKTTPYEQKYINLLKSGFSAGVDGFYFPWKSVGFGLRYDIYKSKGQRDIRTRDDITIHFIGSSVAHRAFFQNKKTSLLTAFWMGYQPYHNNARFVGQDYKLTASTMGWGISLGIDRRITKKLAFNLSGSCFIGSAYKFKKESKGSHSTIYLSEARFEDLSRAELTVGVKWFD